MIVVAVAVLLFKLRVFKKPRWLSRQSKVKTFVFTEDIDMGSSIVARVRGRFSQLLATSASRLTGRRTPWSFRGDRPADRSQEQRSSYGLLTSPRVSLVPSMNQTIAFSDGKTRSWIGFMNEYLGPNTKEVSDPEKQDSYEEKEAPEPLNSPRTSEDTASQLTVPALAHTRTSNPDAPIPAITSSQILFGSAYLPSRSSISTTSTAQQVIQSPTHRGSRLFSPKVRQTSDGERVSFSNISSTGYMLSNTSSSGSSSDGDDYSPLPRPSIYVSPPIKPASDFELLASSIGLAQNGLRKDAGRVPPFPTTSRRNQDT